MQRIVQKVSALYLLWYVVVFVLVVADLQYGFLPEVVKNILARYPYALDFELLFTALFAVWGVFLWRADAFFTKFTAYAFLAQGGATIFLAFILSKDTIHLSIDSIPWIVLGTLLLVIRRK